MNCGGKQKWTISVTLLQGIINDRHETELQTTFIKIRVHCEHQESADVTTAARKNQTSSYGTNITYTRPPRIFQTLLL